MSIKNKNNETTNKNKITIEQTNNIKHTAKMIKLKEQRKLQEEDQKLKQ